MKWKEFEERMMKAMEGNLSMNELKDIIEWMHRCGVLLHFDNKKEDEIYQSSSSSSSNNNNNTPPSSIAEFDPQSLVILNPQWLADVLKKVINHNKKETMNRKDGILSDAELTELWKVCILFE